MSERGPNADADRFFDRFIHLWLARVAAAGAAVWLSSFLLTAVGVVVDVWPLGAADRFFLSGLLGLVGLLVVAACVRWLLAIASVGASATDSTRRAPSTRCMPSARRI